MTQPPGNPTRPFGPGMPPRLATWTGTNPLEFLTDRSEEQVAKVLGLDPGAPDPFVTVPD